MYIVRSTDGYSFTEEWIHQPGEWHPRQLTLHFNMSRCVGADHMMEIRGSHEALGFGLPSCTYRSGFPGDTALAVLQIFRNGQAIYHLLPLSSRLYVLYLYLVCISLCTLYKIFAMFSSCYSFGIQNRFKRTCKIFK